MKDCCLAVALASVLAVSPSLAAAGADPNPNAVQAGSYVVEPNHTRVLFSVSHFGFNDYFGEFSGISGSLSLDPKNAASDRIDVSIPVDTLDVTNAQLEAELKGAGWFNAGQFPTIRFVSKAVTQTGPNTAQILGDLTMHGVTRSVTLEARFNGAGVNPLDKAYTVGFAATGHVKRSDFGVSAYVPMVGDDVVVTISAAFEKRQG